MQCQKCGTTKPPLYTHIINYATMEYTILCKQCHDEEHGKGLSLIEIFNEYTPTITKPCSTGAYRATYLILKKPDSPTITLENLKQYLEALKQKYPDQKFYLTTAKYQGKTLYKLSKKRNPSDKPRVPLYFDLQNQKYYIEKQTLQKQPKLTNYIIMRTLGTLGITQHKYANHIQHNKETSHISRFNTYDSIESYVLNRATLNSGLVFVLVG